MFCHVFLDFKACFFWNAGLAVSINLANSSHVSLFVGCHDPFYPEVPKVAGHPGHPVLPKMLPMTQGPVAYHQVPTL